MSRGRVIPLVGDTHRVVQEFLPWYASGRLDLADIVCVQSHLEVCLRCQAELDLDRKSYNDNNPYGAQILMSFNFDEDLDELENPPDYPEGPEET